MKHLLPALVATALIGVPVTVRADPWGPPPAQNSAAFQIMEQAHTKMQQLHSQARLAMLNSLSPAHRNLLATVVGQLAIAPAPDAAAAAKQLDANLTPSEAKAIVGISTSLEQQVHQVMDATHKQMANAMPNGGPMHKAWGMQGMHSEADQMASDPGMLLMRMAVHAPGLGESHHLMGGSGH
ncbi:MAG: hypothetical protein M3Z41_01810 [Candidatus Eremiobacteraeota bacterium]|nr:hypothetical protein [Candidatus Eremiobacteraeota bacterium]